MAKYAIRSLKPKMLVLVTTTSFAYSTPSFSRSKNVDSSAQQAKQVYEKILDTYQFIGDFSVSPAERNISDELFWRYPFPLPKAPFPIDFTLGEKKGDIPITPGQSRAIQHLNYGRVLFKNQNTEEARQVWLSARARYGKNFPFHKRNDYFISLAYLKISHGVAEQLNFDFDRSEMRLTFANTSTFLSWAFIKKRALSDPELENITPRALYNLAAIYYQFNRFNEAHGTALEGLNFLREHAKSERRSSFRRMIAETWIKDRQYLEAVREFDTLLRLEQDQGEAALAFSRVGDIYFDLNKYELADEAYGWSQAINRSIQKIVPLSFILRGESLFWMGKFSEAQKSLQFGIDSISNKKSVTNLSKTFRSWGALRIADAYLARDRLRKNQRKNDLISEAKLAYFKVEHQFPNTEAAEIAKIRRACLSLPQYSGNNVKHARQLLRQSLKSSTIPLTAIELAESCEVMSYADRERDESFIKKLKSFYGKYPNSIFLDQYMQPLKELRASRLDTYLKASEYHKAISFYEMYKERLFKSLSDDQKFGLFEAYVDVGKIDSAEALWKFYEKASSKSKRTEISTKQFLDLATFFAEKSKLEPKNKQWRKKSQEVIRRYAPENIDIAFNTAYQNRIYRILNTPMKPLHIPWIFETSKIWAKQGIRTTCEITYPILSSWIELNNAESKKEDFLWAEVKSLTKDHFPGIFQKSLDCSEGILNIEANLGQKTARIQEYASLWTQRYDWPQAHIFAGMMWQASERLFAQKGMNPTSKSIWTYLSSLKDDSIPESRFASARLDTTKTETGDLWR